MYTAGIAKFDRRDLVVNLTGMNQTSGGLYKDFTIGEVVNRLSQKEDRHLLLILLQYKIHQHQVIQQQEIQHTFQLAHL